MALSVRLKTGENLALYAGNQIATVTACKTSRVAFDLTPEMRVIFPEELETMLRAAGWEQEDGLVYVHRSGERRRLGDILRDGL